MTRALHIIACTALISAIGTLPAEAKRSRSPTGLSVEGDAQRFEVFTDTGTGGTEVFCAAGDFASRRLRAKQNDRVVIIVPVSPSATRPNRRSVTFALQRMEKGDRLFSGGGLLRPSQTGQSRTVGGARALCNTFR